MKDAFLKYLVAISLFITGINCHCPPVKSTMEFVGDSFNQADQVIKADVVFINKRLWCFEYRIKKAYKGNLDTTEVHSGYFANCGGPNHLGEWILFGKGQDSIFVNTTCDPTFYIDEPEFTQNLFDFVENGGYENWEARQNHERKNRKFASSVITLLTEMKK